MAKLNFLSVKILLGIICVFFLATRLYRITDIPPSVYWDEASIGYNAYAVANTGKDEWGKAFPLHFRAFGEFKLPVYIYATIPTVWIFGLNAFSVRLPAVLFSLGVVILTYFLAKKISGSAAVGLFSSFLVSISPWFFLLSRVGYEATAGLMFYLLAIYLFIFSAKNRWLIPFSVLSFILSAYSYNSFRVIILPTLLLLIVLYFKKLKPFSSKIFPIILSILILVFSMVPIIRIYLFDNGAVRLQAVAAPKTDFAKNYLLHFNPKFLFFSGDTNLRSQLSGFGQLFPIEVILLLAGILYICKDPKANILLILLLLIAPLPAAITRESPHALRAIAMIPFLSIIAAMGVGYIKNLGQKFFVEIVVILAFLLYFIYFFINFLTVYPVESSQYWQYGYKAIYTGYKNEFDKYDKILISDEYAQPYIFELFYQKFDPALFNQTVIRNEVDKWGFSTVKSFGKFEFGKIDSFNNLKNTLIFSTKNISDKKPADLIKFLDGTTAFWVYRL